MGSEVFSEIPPPREDGCPCGREDCRRESYKGGFDAGGGFEAGVVMALRTCGRMEVVHAHTEPTPTEEGEQDG